jgi:hypothetical protein
VAHPIEWLKISWQLLLLLQHAISQQLRQDKANQEGRIKLALQAYKNGQFRSLQRAANAFNIPQRTLTQRYNKTLT